MTVIRPAPRWPHLDVPELWHYRELLFRLAWRDIAVRYKQTSIGVLWAILQPFLTMVVFTLVFGKFADFPSTDVPYPIFVLRRCSLDVLRVLAVGASSSLVVEQAASDQGLLPARAPAPRGGRSFRSWTSCSASSSSWADGLVPRLARACARPCSPLPPDGARLPHSASRSSSRP